MPSPETVIKELAEKINKDFNSFKESNDTRLDAIEKKGTAGADREAKVDKMADDMSKLEEKYQKMETALNRPGAGSEDPKQEEGKQAELAKEGMESYLRKRRMTDEQHAAYVKSFGKNYASMEEFKALSVDSNPDGGFFVRPEISTQMTKKIFESSPMRQLADSLTISSDAFEEVYDNDEPESGWVGERETRGDSNNNQVKMIRIPTHALFSQPKATQKILDDSAIDIESWHQGKVIGKFGRDEATAFISGNGVSRPRGITTYTSGDDFDKIEQVASGSSGVVVADGLIDLQNSLLEEFQKNATFMMKRATATAVRKLKDGQGRYLWSTSGNLTEGILFSLLGNPVRYANDMPAIAADSLSIAYGDFRAGYLIIDRLGIRVLRDPFTSKGFVKFYTTKRVGGGVRQFQAIKLQKLEA